MIPPLKIRETRHERDTEFPLSSNQHEGKMNRGQKRKRNSFSLSCFPLPSAP